MSFRHTERSSRRRGTRSILVGNIVDFATERIYFEHRRSFFAAENAHCEIKRAATRAVRSRRGPCSQLWTLNVHGVWYRCAGAIVRNRRRSIARPPPFTAVASASALVRWTRSASGSRTISIASNRLASDWMTEISSASRVSLTFASSPRLSSSKAEVRDHQPAQTIPQGRARPIVLKCFNCWRRWPTTHRAEYRPGRAPDSPSRNPAGG